MRRTGGTEGEAWYASRFATGQTEMKHFHQHPLPTLEEMEYEPLELVEDVPADVDVCEEVMLEVRKDELRRALRTLPIREQHVLELRFGFENDEEMTLQAIGDALRYTRERIRQIEYGALKTLRATLRTTFGYVEETWDHLPAAPPRYWCWFCGREIDGYGICGKCWEGCHK